MADPVVTANFTRLDFGESIPLSEMFDFSDADGDALVSLTVRDFDFGVGQFFVNGTAQPQVAEFTVTAAELPNTLYRAGFFTGGENFSVSASDGNTFSPLSTNIIRVGNTAPTVTAIPSVVPIAGQIPFLSMIRVTDLENDPIAEYRFRDNGSGSGTGRFILDGDAFEANVWHSITALEAERLRYEGGSFLNAESFSVTADDGLRSAVTAGQVVTGNSRPVITPINDANVIEGQTILVRDTIFVTDADNDAIIRYFVVDRRDNADSGFLVLNGERLDSATFHSLTPTQFANLEYEGGPAGPVFENIGIQVLDDNGALSETVDYRIRTTTQAVIRATDKTSVLTNEVTLAERLFDAFDPDGSTIRSYFFVDRRPNANGGFWQFRGNRMPSAQWFQVGADELDQLSYVGATFGPDAEFIGIQALDASGWSQPVDLAILTDARPSAVGIDSSILEGYPLDVGPLISGTNSTGTPAEAFRLTDVRTNANGGFFEFQGTRLPSGQFFEVPAAELDDLKYIGGAFGPQTEPIRLQSIVGGVLSDPTFFNISTRENRFAPEVDAFNVNARTGSIIDFASMFSWTDGDGPPTNIDEVRFFDTGVETNSGFFTINGVRQDAGVWIPVDYDLVTSGAVQYHVSNRNDFELYRVTVDDGRFVSTLDTAQIQAIANPVLTASQNDFSVDTIERIPIGDFITQTDSGPPLTQYQVYDENTDIRSGRIELDGVDLQQGIVHTLTAAQFDRLVFKGAEADFGRQIDGMLVRGFNNIGLATEWTRFNVNTDPVGENALVGGPQYANFSGTPITEITYAFIDSNVPIPSYYPPPPVNCNPGVVPGVENAGTLPFNQPQREATRQLLESISAFANVEFREVAFIDSAGGPSGVDAQITFGHWAQACGNPAYAYPTDGSGLASVFGDVWLDWQQAGWNPLTFDPATGQPTSVQGPGTSFDLNILRTVGTSLGFSTATELSIFNNFDYNTVQSGNHFNGNSQFDAAYPELPSTFQIYDILYLQQLYGVRTEFNPENNHYRFEDAHQQAIYDTGGIDTLNLTQQTVDTIIDLREGQRSTLQDAETGAAFDNSVLIPYGVVIENGRSGSGNDTLGGNEISNSLFGNDGEDTLIGRGGNDVLRGGDEADTYVWNLGDGRDTIIDFDQNVLSGVRTEIDTIRIVDATGQLDLLADDLTFRRLGDNLRIDLTLNQAEAQGSIVIQNFSNIANQVERLSLFGPPATTAGDNQQVGENIDLISVWEQAGTLGQRFRVTETDGAYGRLVAPV